jgi:hypothetical protein
VVARLARIPHKLARSARGHLLKQYWFRHNLKVSLRRNKPLRCVLSSEFPDQPALLGGAQGRRTKLQNHSPRPAVCQQETFDIAL